MNWLIRAASGRMNPNTKQFILAKQEASKRFLGPTDKPRLRAFAASASAEQNVVGVGVGEKTERGRPTGVQAVKFFVRVKYPDDQIDKAQRLPGAINGLPTDVEQSGEFRRFAKRRRGGGGGMPNPQARFRPAQPGCSIGFQDPNNQFIMAGTFGALVKDASGSYILSNNHVLADESRLPAGAPIFQPGLLDHGKATTDQIAELTRFVPLVPNGFNSVDAAIAKPLAANLVSRDILHIGPPNGTAAAAIDMVVHKFGRTTGYRAGRIVSIDTDVKVGYETGDFSFEHQIIIVGSGGTSFSDEGDSGSLILERSSGNAVALLFAGSASHTIANHLEDVLAALRVSLA